MQVDLNTILTGVAVIGIAAIFKQLYNLNGSVGRMKVWQEQHERQDDERHNTVMALLEMDRR